MNPVGAALHPGTTFAGDFVIIRPLNQGGMGAVYVAEQRSTGRACALKVMHPQLMQDATLRARFEQEAKIGAKIRSDHVVLVVGAGIDVATQMPWLAMELLEGSDLAAHVGKHGPRPVGEVTLLLQQLCHALGAAHAAQPPIVHRDIKPENLFLARSQLVGMPFVLKILDFGIARILADAKTKATQNIGSPLWMAPEQALRGQGVSPATDVWAIGLVAFYLLTGKIYWPGAYDPDSNPMMLMMEVLNEPIVSASERARQFGVAAPAVPGFDAWFARCVDRTPSQRHRDAGAAWEAFARLTDRSSPASAESLPTRSSFRPAPTVPMNASVATSMPGSTAPRGGDGRKTTTNGGLALFRWVAVLVGVVLAVVMIGGAMKERARPRDSQQTTIAVPATLKPEPKTPAKDAEESNLDSLDDKAVGEVARRNAIGVRKSCYEKYVEEGPADAKVQVHIRPDGSVSSVDKLSGSPPDFLDCLARIAMNWKFPQSSAGGTYPIPFIFN